MSNLIQKSKNITQKVQKSVMSMEEKGELNLPDDYSASNALKSAFLQLQETVDKNKKPALDVATQPSIYNALLEMVTLGLTPAKDQGYFIVRGNQLTFQRSYFGNMALAKRLAGAVDVVAQVIFEDDKFTYDIKGGRLVNIKHEQEWQNRSGKITGAYATLSFDDGRPDWTEVMTMDQIKQAWGQGYTYKEDKNYGTHHDFEEEMCKKTVINRATKKYIKSSSDANLSLAEARALDGDMSGEKIIEQEKQEENASEEFIEGDFEDIVEDLEDEDTEVENKPPETQNKQGKKSRGSKGSKKKSKQNKGQKDPDRIDFSDDEDLPWDDE